MKKNKLFLKLCAGIMSAVLMLDGNIVTSFATDNAEKVEESVIEVDESEVEEDGYGISLEEVQNAPDCPTEWTTYKLDTNKSELWFKSKLNNNGYSQIQFRAANGTNPSSVSNGWDVCVYTGSNLENTILSRTQIQMDAYASSLINVGNKEIYICVKNHSDYFWTNQQPFEIKINKVEADSWESEWNNNIQSAMEIKSGTTYIGSLYTIGDVDYFKYTTEGKGYFNVKFNADPELANMEKLGYKWDVSILDSDGSYLYTREQTKNDMTYCYPFEENHTFYIKVESHDTLFSENAPRYQPYNICVNFTEANDWEIEYNNSIDTANDMSVGSVIHGSTHYNNDVDFFKFNVTQKGDYNIKMETTKYYTYSSGYNNIYLLDGNGKNIYSIKEILSGDIFSYVTEKPIALNKGTYYLKITTDQISSYKRNEGANYKLSVYSDGITPNDDGKNDDKKPQNGTYTISYNGLDGVEFDSSAFVSSFDPATMKKAIKLPTAKNMTKTGFKFLGWYDQSGKKVKKITKKMKQNVVLEAKWKENQYSIIYQVKKPAKGVRVVGKVTADKKGSYTAVRTIKGTEISASGYKLAGWTRVKNSATVDYKVNDKVSKLEPRNNKKVKLYAIWEPANK